jgi:hypothetical protein
MWSCVLRYRALQILRYKQVYVCVCACVCVCVCICLLACLLALKEEACQRGSRADNLCCCSPVSECISDINVNYVNVREREHGEWRAKCWDIVMKQTVMEHRN